MADKAPNYSDEMVAEMVDRYTAANSDDWRSRVVAELAAEFGKTPASIRAKLVREGVYVAKTRTNKSGGAIEKKADIVNEIAEAIHVSAEILESLEKATKKALGLVRDAVTSSD